MSKASEALKASITAHQLAREARRSGDKREAAQQLTIAAKKRREALKLDPRQKDSEWDVSILGPTIPGHGQMSKTHRQMHNELMAFYRDKDV